MFIKNHLNRSTGSGTSYISQIGIVESRAYGKSNSHQIYYFGLYTNSKYDYQKLSKSIHRIWYLPYKSNRHSAVLGIGNIGFVVNRFLKLYTKSIGMLGTWNVRSNWDGGILDKLNVRFIQNLLFQFRPLISSKLISSLIVLLNWILISVSGFDNISQVFLSERLTLSFPCSMRYTTTSCMLYAVIKAIYIFPNLFHTRKTSYLSRIAAIVG